jgi:hypothetical protein
VRGFIVDLRDQFEPRRPAGYLPVQTQHATSTLTAKTFYWPLPVYRTVEARNAVDACFGLPHNLSPAMLVARDPVRPPAGTNYQLNIGAQQGRTALAAPRSYF